MVVIESATTRNRQLEKMNVVEVSWPDTYINNQTVTHLPSRLAIKSWLEMVGFVDVTICDVYSKHTAWQRAVLTARRNSDSKPYVNYFATGLNPDFVAGATE